MTMVANYGSRQVAIVIQLLLSSHAFTALYCTYCTICVRAHQIVTGLLTFTCAEIKKDGKNHPLSHTQQFLRLTDKID